MLKKQKRTEMEIRDTKIVITLIGGGGGHIGDDLAEDLSKVDVDVKGVTVSLNAFNTDVKDLSALNEFISLCPIGENVTGGFGASTDPAIGRAAATESKDLILEVFEGADIAVIVACLGGGTGTGATPYIVQQLHEALQEQAALPIHEQKAIMVIVTTPFKHEGFSPDAMAEKAIEELQGYNIPIFRTSNDLLLSDGSNSDRELSEMFSEANQVISRILGRMIRSLTKRHNRRNIDRNDIVGNLILKHAPDKDPLTTAAYFGVGYGSGENAIAQALEEASSNKYQETSLDLCKNVIISVDAKKITESDWAHIQDFMSEHRHYKDADWRYGLSDDFEPLPFETGQDAAVFVIGVGYVPDATQEIAKEAYASPAIPRPAPAVLNYEQPKKPVKQPTLITLSADDILEAGIASGSIN